MTGESNTTGTAITSSTAGDGVQAPADSPKPAPLHCSACDARLPCRARFCSACRAAQATPVEDEATVPSSQFGGSSTDLAELLSARGHVVTCPHCDELNHAAAAWCSHCGQLLPPTDTPSPATTAKNAPRTSDTYDDGKAQTSPAAQSGTKRTRHLGEAMALFALLGAIALALLLARPPTGPAREATASAASRSIPAAQPVDPVVSAAPPEPVLRPPVSPSPSPEADGENRDALSSSVAPASTPQGRAQPPGSGAKKVAKAAVLRTSAPSAIDELYRKRAAEHCKEGLSGLLCRQKLRFELCQEKWTQDAHPGMELCRLNP